MKLFYKLRTLFFFLFLLKHVSISRKKDFMKLLEIFFLYKILQEHSYSTLQSLLVILSLIGLNIVRFKIKAWKSSLYSSFNQLISFMSRQPLKKISTQHCQENEAGKIAKLSLSLLSSQFIFLSGF